MIGGRFPVNYDAKYLYGAKSKNLQDCSGLVCQAFKSEFPGIPKGTHGQMEYMSKNGWKDLTKQVKDGDYSSLEPGDVVYMKSSGSPSGMHVKMFRGLDKDGMATWAEAKGKSMGVGTYGGGIPTRTVVKAFRPPRLRASTNPYM